MESDEEQRHTKIVRDTEIFYKRQIQLTLMDKNLIHSVTDAIQ